jgi:hypothetical protein
LNFFCNIIWEFGCAQEKDIPVPEQPAIIVVIGMTWGCPLG